jgi:hypothetical protein
MLPMTNIRCSYSKLLSPDNHNERLASPSTPTATVLNSQSADTLSMSLGKANTELQRDSTKESIAQNSLDDEQIKKSISSALLRQVNRNNAFRRVQTSINIDRK